MPSNIRKKLASRAILAEDTITTPAEETTETGVDTTQTPEVKDTTTEVPEATTEETTVPEDETAAEKTPGSEEAADTDANDDQAFIDAIKGATGIDFNISNLQSQRYHKAGPFSILNNQTFFSQLQSQPSVQSAATFVIDTIRSMNEALGGFKQYNKPSDARLQKLRADMMKQKSVAGIASVISNYGLKFDGLGVLTASLENLLDTVELNADSTLAEVFASQDRMAKVAALLTLMLDN